MSAEDPAKTTIRNAASLIVVDRSAAAPRVLMGKRHSGHRFMPNRFVFPGGAVEAADRRVRPATALDAAVETKLAAKLRRPSRGLPRALALAALRETFEETGLVIGEAAGPTGEGGEGGGAWAAFQKLGFAPALHGIDFLARAITPPGPWRRFDARFFVIDASRVQARVEDVAHAEAELVELVWPTLGEADALDLHPITRSVLADLKAMLNGADDPARPRPLYRQVRGKFLRQLI